MVLVEANVDYAQIPIKTERDGRSRLLYAKIDLGDYALIKAHAWHVSWDGRQAYAHTGNRGNGITMGRLLLGEGELGNLGRVQHLNGNGMDCRRGNIRLATQAQILANRRPSGGISKYKGVTWDAHQGKWIAVFRGAKLGRFHDEKDAARAFDDAAKACWGEGAYQNFPLRPQGVPMTGAKARLLTFAVEACLDAMQVQADPGTARALLDARDAVARWVDEPPFWVSPQSDPPPWVEPQRFETSDAAPPAQ